MIQYLVGDATEPVGEGKKIIAHVCNDLGGWGAGFVLALSNKWVEPESFYREWGEGKLEYDDFTLGETQFIPVEPDIDVANMIAQHAFGSDGLPPIRYDALESCLNQVVAYIRAIGGASVHMPRIGCGLAGGDWDTVAKVIDKTLGVEGIEVYVYDLKAE